MRDEKRNGSDWRRKRGETEGERGKPKEQGEYAAERIGRQDNGTDGDVNVNVKTKIHTQSPGSNTNITPLGTTSLCLEFRHFSVLTLNSNYRLPLHRPVVSPSFCPLNCLAPPLLFSIHSLMHCYCTICITDIRVHTGDFM